MEGRLQPPAAIDDEHNAVTPLPLPPGREHHTYIVQVPKDQVYRVPPPENALFVEQQRRNPINGRKNTNNCYRFSWFLIYLLTILIVLGLTITFLYFIFRPKNPEFSVTKFEVKKPPTTTKNNTHWVPNYVVSMRAKNPNGRTGLSYAKDGDVSMYYNSTVVATGKFPGLDQDPNASSPVKIDLSGSKDRPLSAAMRRSMNSTSKSQVAISFELEMKVEVKGKIGGMKIYGMNPTVDCKIKLSSLTDDARVLSQECK